MQQSNTRLLVNVLTDDSVRNIPQFRPVHFYAIDEFSIYIICFGLLHQVAEHCGMVLGELGSWNLGPLLKRLFFQSHVNTDDVILHGDEPMINRKSDN
jgi:hypothetical protein